MFKTALLAGVASLVIAVDWLRFEEPRSGGGRPFVLTVVAIAPVFVRPLWLRLVAIVLSGVLAAYVAFSLSPLAVWPGEEGYFGPLGSRFSRGFLDFYDYRLPIDRLPGPSRLVKGWRLSGITRFATGVPVTVVETDDNSFLGTAGAGAISLPIDRPNFTPGSLSISDPRSGTYFNTGLFTAEAPGQLGNASRRFFSGPGLNNWDIALLKDTAIHEGMNMEFRTELFNAFNHAQFGLPDGNINSSSFGLVNTANPPRIMQLSLKLLF